MNKHILFFGFLLTVFGLRIDAQTLKNIYRNNLPVLQIPAAFIDKVETVDIDGQPTLRVIQFNGFVNQFPVAQIDSITHTVGTAFVDPQLGNLRTSSVMGVVRGPNGTPEMNAVVRSSYGGEETRTDLNGIFFLNNILVYDKLGYITITKPGFHQGSRSFLPLEQGRNRVNVQIFPLKRSGSFNSTTGGTVTSGLLQLNFPANAFQLNGQPYNGIVNVYAQALDPSSAEMFDQMPGELLGDLNDSLRLLRSFGMASIELRDFDMNELQLINGISATLTFNIPSALQTQAPASIDWWSFDEILGYWKHEGEAQKQGTNYVGLASHFSWWNLDVPGAYNEFQGTVISTDGNPISEAQIELVSPTLGTSANYTNSFGEFSGRIPKNQNLTLNVNLTCESTNDWVLAYTETLISQEDSITNDYTVQLNGFYPISGVVVNCSGQPVASGYVRIGPQVFITNQGQFTIQACQTGNYQIQGFDSSIPNSIKASNINPVLVDNNGVVIGNIEACTEISGLVTDFEGNDYSTILIGTQWWMSENLKTTHFADGSEIPNVMGDTEWIELNTPAWCDYNNSDNYNNLYGKLYNWYTTVDTRNVCPTGWHAPSKVEWTTLINYLGGQNIAGGKMKSVTGWFLYDTLVTNESGFSGLPGGIRDPTHIQSFFYDAGVGGLWWSSTDYSSSAAWYCSLYSYDVTAYLVNSDNNKSYGASVRCIRD